MDTITIIDTSLSTDNVGDEIIMDAVNEVLASLFPNAFFFRIPSHEYLSDRSHRYMKMSSLTFIGGTNILASSVWRMRWRDAVRMPGAICLGVGWGEYHYRPHFERRMLLRRVLSPTALHSVRDCYTGNKLAGAGRRNVSTACPTMWNLTPDHCKDIPRRKATDVVFALSARHPEPAADLAMIELLQANYRNLYFFSQMRNDYSYLKSFNVGKVKQILPTLCAYNRILQNEDVDFIGSRLHGGIRALQNKRRSMIVGIDSRSIEIAKDTGLPVLPRARIGELESWILSDYKTRIELPDAKIAEWKAQFGS